MVTKASRGEQVKHPHAFLTCLGLFVGAIFLTWGVDCSTRWNAMRDNSNSTKQNIMIWQAS
jgi:hypothetical protein